MKNYFVHETSIVDEKVKIGKNTKIWHFCHISSRAKIGKNCKIGQNVFVGEGVRIGNNVSVYSGVTIEDDVFTNVKKPRSYIDKKKKYEKTKIMKGATLGANSTIICGNNIGEYSFVGAGSVVTKSVKKETTVVGNPAKKIRFI